MGKVEQADIEQLIYISLYRGIHHQDGSPSSGQRTHTNVRFFFLQVKAEMKVANKIVFV